MKTVILGYGMTGKATAHVLGISPSDCYGHEAKKNPSLLLNYTHVILCLPSPTNADGTQDLSAIKFWLGQIKAFNPGATVVIRSTVLPGTTREFSETYGLKIAHVPEFLTEATAIEDSVNTEFLVIGADDILIQENVKWMFSQSRSNPKRIILCSSATAEVIKYAMNSFFALKVIYGNQLWDVCNKVGAQYQQVEEALQAHKWGSRNGWNVWHGGFRGYGGKCLPKDVAAFASTFDIALLKEVERINKTLLKK